MQPDYQDLVGSVLVTAHLGQAPRVNIEAERLKRRLFEDLLGGRVALRERAAAMGPNPGASCVVAVAVLLGARHRDPNAMRWVAEALQRHVGVGLRPAFVVARGHEVVAVIGIDSEDEGRIRPQVGGVLEMLRRTHIILVAVGLSTACQGIAALPRAYDQAPEPYGTSEKLGVWSRRYPTV